MTMTGRSHEGAFEVQMLFSFLIWMLLTGSMDSQNKMQIRTKSKSGFSAACLHLQESLWSSVCIVYHPLCCTWKDQPQPPNPGLANHIFVRLWNRDTKMPVHLCCHLNRGHVDVEIVRLEARKACLQREAATDTHHLARRAEERLWEQLLRFQMASQSLVPVPLRPNCLAVGIYDKKKKKKSLFLFN